MAGGMVGVANQQNLRPKIGFETMLRFDDCEIVAGGNDAPVENHKIVIGGRQHDFLAAAVNGDQSK